MIKGVIKRDGRKVKYNKSKIIKAVTNALVDSNEGTSVEATRIANAVEGQLNKNSNAVINIEDIQDAVEQQLMNHGFNNSAKHYILYRANRTKIREANTSLMKTIDEITHIDARKSDMKRDNANIDGNTAMGSMLQIGAACAKAYNAHYLLKPEHAEAYHNGYIHIHDFDFYSLTATCCQIDVKKLFKNGFSTGHGYLREPNSIQSYTALAAIAIQANQNDQHGGQSIPNFDYGMAEGVSKSYRNNFIKYLTLGIDDYLDLENPIDQKEIVDIIKFAEEHSGIKINLSTFETSEGFELNKFLRMKMYGIYGIDAHRLDKIINKTHLRAKSQTNRDTYQAMESFIHNLNTMHSRAGAQTPFSSINYGTDTSPEGRMVIENVLLALEAGLGHGETCIFPIHIFKVKEGVNYNEGDPNYDLFKLSCRVSAKRLFPNYVFLDSPFNLQYYKKGHPETEVATMGCRTRVIGNVFDPKNEIAYSRGNLSFTSINLPRLAIESEGDEDLFFSKLKDMLELVSDQLLDRFEIQANKKVYNYPFLMGQGVWLGSDKLSPDDSVREVIKHGTLSIGFIGLAEVLVSLYGEHHGQSKEIQKKGIKIIKFMRDFCDKKANKLKLNFSLLATPAEGLSGRFVRMDQKRFGKIKGVTDKEYYTNSFHIPVYFDISIADKIKLEAPYHALCNAGHISYVELDGDTVLNVEAFEAVVRYMHDCQIGYGSINHPVDRDPVCGYVGIIGDTCPRCGRHEGEEISEEVLNDLRKKYPGLPLFKGIN